MKIHYHSDHLGSASFVTDAEGDVGTDFVSKILESVNQKIGTGDIIKMRKGLIHQDSKDLIKYHREASSTDVLPTLVN
ncbi:MAG: hypothetical protein PWQ43_672 [Rikenellaceae bacterium]|jgi:hypothetical protein|nr:hypothetical protein [Rikenellaceae bacterium]